MTFGGNLTSFNGVDSRILSFQASDVGVNPAGDMVVTDLVTATETEMKNLGGPAADLATANTDAVLPYGIWFLTSVAIRHGIIGSEAAVRVRVMRDMSTPADGDTGTDIISNILTQGAAKIDYINFPLSSVAGVLNYHSPQAGAGAVDNADPAVTSTGWVSDALRTFDCTVIVPPTVGCTLQASTGTTVDVAAPGFLVDLIFSRIGA